MSKAKRPCEYCTDGFLTHHRLEPEPCKHCNGTREAPPIPATTVSTRLLTAIADRKPGSLRLATRGINQWQASIELRHGVTITGKSADTPEIALRNLERQLFP